MNGKTYDDRQMRLKKKSKSATTIKLRIKLSQTLLELQTHGKMK